MSAPRESGIDIKVTRYADWIFSSDKKGRGFFVWIIKWEFASRVTCAVLFYCFHNASYFVKGMYLP